MDQSHAEDLRSLLLQGLPDARTKRGVQDTHGERFTAWIPVTGPNGRTVEVKTGWIYHRADGRQAEHPRLTTAYVDAKEEKKRRE